MSEQGAAPVGLSPELEALVTRLVDERVQGRLQDIESTLAALKGDSTACANCPEDRATLVVFSGEMDTLFAALTIAVGAASMGMQVSIFFTFWGLTALRKSKTYEGKSTAQKMVAMMLPDGPAKVPTSRMNMGGLGPPFFKYLMQQRNVESLPNMVALAQELGVRYVACEMSMGVMGVTREELLDGIDYGGVAVYLADAARSKITLFV
jgi:peroxiredoxin family protein